MDQIRVSFDRRTLKALKNIFDSLLIHYLIKY